MKGFKRKQHKPVKKGQSNQNSVVGNLKNTPTVSIKVLFMIGIAVVVIVVGWLLYSYIDGRNSNTKISQACSENVITAQTAVDLTSSSVAVLKPTVDKIVKTSNYDRDPSCLYILTKYYIGISDPVNARKNYDQLTKLYTSNQVYDPDIRNAAASPEQFKTVLELLEKEQQQIDKTSKVIKP